MLVVGVKLGEAGALLLEHRSVAVSALACLCVLSVLVYVWLHVPPHNLTPALGGEGRSHAYVTGLGGWDDSAPMVCAWPRPHARPVGHTHARAPMLTLNPKP